MRAKKKLLFIISTSQRDTPTLFICIDKMKEQTNWLSRIYGTVFSDAKITIRNEEKTNIYRVVTSPLIATNPTSKQGK